MIYNREISELDKKIVEHYVVDFKEWIDTAITQKIACRKKELLKELTLLALAEKKPLPGGEIDQVLALHLDSPNYKSRKEREALEKPVAQVK